ncbi:hypothetical protein PGT21_007355 [Puccinia graminis f. sp. tritici]|uniref:Uncharacterized protein n=1 Tax=Puccinia graminis f. sp. tritici TaxID=56615 RepID=A0A5B0NVM3_PUCGR|nr:hypothetical protein PGT21_007355 [Puccinia graminis f. sp. tritici]KAA1093667.1 hypothetical protein PGTUg99_017966 [Puccinia graminis f. sp. tritici]
MASPLTLHASVAVGRCRKARLSIRSKQRKPLLPLLAGGEGAWDEVHSILCKGPALSPAQTPASSRRD